MTQEFQDNGNLCGRKEKEKEKMTFSFLTKKGSDTNMAKG